MTQDLPPTLVESTYQAFTAARHLDDERFSGAKAALVAMARKIDAWDVIVRYAIEDQVAAAKGGRPTVPQNDNVTLASYAKLSEQLGLTPTGQKALQQPMRQQNGPEKVASAGTEAPDGGKADQRPGKAAKISQIRARRSVPGAG